MARFPVLVSLIALVMTLVSCSKTTAPDTEISFSLTPSAAVGSSGAPVVLSGRAINAGGKPVWYTSGCGPATGVRIRFFDPAGAEVYLGDPRIVPACADLLVTLDPGREVRNDVSFTGVIYVARQGGYEPVAAPFGVYTARGEFGFSREASVSHTTATCSTTFRWEPAPGNS